MYTYVTLEVEPNHSFYFHVISEGTDQFKDCAIECRGMCAVDLNHPREYIRCFIDSATSHGFDYIHKSVTVKWSQENRRIVLVPVKYIEFRKPRFYASEHEKRIQETEVLLIGSCRLPNGLTPIIAGYTHECDYSMTCILPKWRALDTSREQSEAAPSHLASMHLRKYFGAKDSHQVRDAEGDELDKYQDADLHEVYEYQALMNREM